MKQIKHLGMSNSILNNYISELRDNEIQKDRMRFRQNLTRIGEIFAYEISKTLNYNEVNVITPLGVSPMSVMQEPLVLVTVLRAGLPFQNGMLNIFDKAEGAFVSAYRKHERDGSFEIQMDYISVPDLEGKVLIIADTMLATGKSLLLTYRELINTAKPKHTHIASVIASTQGVEYLVKNIPSSKYTLWVGAMDEELTAQSYIVPGLGDAGDLAFGAKLSE